VQLFFLVHNDGKVNPFFWIIHRFPIFFVLKNVNKLTTQVFIGTVRGQKSTIQRKIGVKRGCFCAQSGIFAHRGGGNLGDFFSGFWPERSFLCIMGAWGNLGVKCGIWGLSGRISGVNGKWSTVNGQRSTVGLALLVVWSLTELLFLTECTECTEFFYLPQIF